MHSHRVAAMQLYFNISIHAHRKHERNFYKAIYATLEVTNKPGKETKTFTPVKLTIKVTRLLTALLGSEQVGNRVPFPAYRHLFIGLACRPIDFKFILLDASKQNFQF